MAHKRIRQITLSDVPLEKQKELCRQTGISHKRDLSGVHVYEYQSDCVTPGCNQILRYKVKDDKPDPSFTLCYTCLNGTGDAA